MDYTDLCGGGRVSEEQFATQQQTAKKTYSSTGHSEIYDFKSKQHNKSGQIKNGTF